jgi:DNA invertase Pin-like site-specific DNA recombinase
MIQVSGNGHKRAAVYLRVSTDEQREQGYGLVGQFNECIEYAGRLGFQLVGGTSYKLEGGKLIESTDAGAIPAFVEDYTGFSRFDDRPTGKQLMAVLKERQVDAIIAARVDRIARDSLEARIAARAWLKTGVELHTAKNGRITNDNDIVFLIESWQGHEDYTKIVKNLRDGRNNKARGNKVVGCGRAPFGYRFIRDAKLKIVGIEIYEPEARIVRLIFAWYICGDESGKPLSLMGIATCLTAMEIPSPRPDWKKRVHKPTVWFQSTVNLIVANETYCGKWHYRKADKRKVDNRRCVRLRDISEQIAVDVPTIIDRATWERAQARREYNSRMAKRNCKRNYLLRGRVRCGCGRAMAGRTTRNGAGTEYYYYACCSRNEQSTARQKICVEKDVRCDRLDNLAWESVEGLFADLDRLWVNVKKAQEVELTAQDPKRAELQAVEDFIAQADREADEIALAMRQAKGRVAESLQKQQDDLNARLERYHKRRGELIAELGARRLTDDAIQDIMTFARDVREGIDEADFETKQRIFGIFSITWGELLC